MASKDDTEMDVERIAEQNTVRVLYVEKKPANAVEAERLKHDLVHTLGLAGVQSVRILNRYAVSGVGTAAFEQAVLTVFAEPQLDLVHRVLPVFSEQAAVIGVEPLPGQFDQRGDSAAQCIQLLTQDRRPVVKTARIYVVEAAEEHPLSSEDQAKVRRHLINPVESREAALTVPPVLTDEAAEPSPVPVLAGFCSESDPILLERLKTYNLAMSAADLLLIRDFFRDHEHRDPTLTELRVLDTYWSDHCRHTTFLTRLNQVKFLGAAVQSDPDGRSDGFTEVLADAYARYLNLRETVYGDRLPQKPVCLMDVATLAMKALGAEGRLADLDESDEINACSIKVTIQVDGRDVDYLLMFKNETHNHPTEIEPFGGAATCLGGAIRDPLSGRSYVYQAMRVTGAGNPNTPIEETLHGKLPQRTITKGAADGYSSYGNQIGLATGQVREIYHPGYVAKRMEIGAVIAAAPADQVIREQPEPGDVVILVGGQTGRDGCGGATGSSRAHTDDSVRTAGAEVQKGNPPVERKLQRLFRNPLAARMIRRCNDFGAGGVCVAIGELADGLEINLDLVPLKYQGLDGTELAISESQERMAVVVRPDQKDKFIALADQENLEATAVAAVTDTGRMVMTWKGERIVDLSRELIDTNGAPQFTDVVVQSPGFDLHYFIPQFSGSGFDERLKHSLGLLNACSQKGLGEQFDATIGAATVLMPYGGRYQDTPEEGMAARLPAERGETDTVSLMTFGFDPSLSSWSPYHGAYYAVLQSLAKLTAMGGSPGKARLTFQEYFPDTRRESHWGLPLAALLGALDAQMAFGVPAVGGKDSMSGTFEQLEVPPTLVSFAVGTRRSNAIHSATLTAVNSALYYIPVPKDDYYLPDAARFMAAMRVVHALQKEGRVHAAAAADGNGVAVRVAQMCFGNRLGFSFNEALPADWLFMPDPGALIVEVPQERLGGSTIGRLEDIGGVLLGYPSSTPLFSYGDAALPVQTAYEAWTATLEPVFPTQVEEKKDKASGLDCPTLTKAPPLGLTADAGEKLPPAGQLRDDQSLLAQTMYPRTPGVLKEKVRVLIPVFPGTNCEYDSAEAFRRAGAKPELFVLRNLTPAAIRESMEALVQKMDAAQIVMLPGGFSAGDEPEGSGKFIAAVFRNPAVADAVNRLLYERDGLMIGICNGFQALIKLGLLPHGAIRQAEPDDPTLTFNTIGRHVSCYVDTRVVSNRSPWLSRCKPGEIYTIPVSHGEGRFAADAETLQKLAADDQICLQYVDFNGRATMSRSANPNGSDWAVEGICSPDGRVFGRMGHSERYGRAVGINIPGRKQMPIMASGVDYFKI